MHLNNTIGIFEAKTRFSQLCDQVNSTGQPLVVERRGKALVMISPVPSSDRQESEDILAAWQRWTSEHPEEDDDFPEVSSLRSNKGVPALG
jgi:antitoxin (DNA-binding transcriptional repressor) of toxin-antitoxin stability system